VDPYAVPRRRGVVRAARAVGRYLLHGLELVGYAHALTVFVAAEIPPRRAPGADLPPGHPERLVPDLPLTLVERWLWAQLGSGVDAQRPL
jgi:hypothetical protein